MSSNHHRYKRKSNAPYVILFLFALTLLVLAVCFLFNPKSVSPGNVTLQSSSSSVPSSSEIISSSNMFSESKDVSSVISSKETSSIVGDSYFDDAAFVGNSLIEGLVLYNSITNAPSFCTKGMNVNKFYTEACIPLQDGTTATIANAIGGYDFKKIFIMFGINEIGWPYETAFIEKYSEIIDCIKELYPDAKICIQSILPVTKQKSDNDTVFTNSKIDYFNVLISDMAAEKEVIYIDIAKNFKDENGALFAEASTEGIHLSKQYNIKWYELLKQAAPLIDETTSGIIEIDGKVSENS